jgi:hypothetical protein
MPRYFVALGQQADLGAGQFQIDLACVTSPSCELFSMARRAGIRWRRAGNAGQWLVISLARA